MADQPKFKGGQPKGENYHNGVATAPEENTNKSRSGTKMSKKDRKVTKLESLTKKLEAEKAEMAEQLKILQAEIKAIKSAQDGTATVTVGPSEEEVEQESVHIEVLPGTTNTHTFRSIMKDARHGNGSAIQQNEKYEEGSIDFETAPGASSTHRSKSIGTAMKFALDDNRLPAALRPSCENDVEDGSVESEVASGPFARVSVFIISEPAVNIINSNT
ncbi:uncharacterized protein LOC134213872 [Armigeres subalbatus]|uniref:uncharacterized protein LOC134213872 n=1 Tax=Armigeres subalbatus TaxID=124917 RepID=UPI002ED04EF1